MQIIVCKLVHLLPAIDNKAPEPKQSIRHYGGATKMLRQAGRIMKLTAILILGVCLQIHAAGYGQRITLSEKDVPLERVFKKIQQQTDYKFLYTSQLLEGAPRVTVSVRDASVHDVLALIFKEGRLDYEVNEKTIVVRPRREQPAKQLSLTDLRDPIEVRGVITDENGAPASGVNVMVKGTSKGTTTNLKGEFVLRDVAENAVLLITSVGYDRQEVLVKNKDFLSLKLKVAVGNLDEMQVIAYGTTSRRFSTGNISTVKATDIEKRPIQNPLLALQGRVPGIEVTQLTGLSGGGVTVRIQGRNSLRLSGLEPLIVIDGVPYAYQLFDNGNFLDNLVQGGSPLNYINPNDIESIDVLKDADATSIYGSRAGNGAILITTKKGKASGLAKLNFNLQQGWGKVTRRAKMLNTKQYLEMRYEAYKNDGIDISTLTPSSRTYDLTVWDTTRYTDWQKELIGGTAHYTNINASISAGTSIVQYLIGATFNRRTTVFPGDFDDKMGGLNFNINAASKNQKLQVQLSGSYMYDQNHLPGTDLTQNAVLLAPNAPNIYNEDGTLHWAPNAAGNSTWDNPMAYTVSTDFVNNTKNLLANARVTYRLLSGLEVAGSFGYTNMQNDLFLPMRLELYKPENRPFYNRIASYGKRNMSNWIIEPQIRYTTNLNKGKIEALIGSTWQKNSSDMLQFDGIGYPNDQMMQSILAANVKNVNSSNFLLYKYNAFFGRLSINWDEKYLVNLTARRDGSSRFGDKNKFHNFSSIGLGWIFSQEPLIKKNIPFISFGKLRASYGTTGNDQIPDYLYVSTYAITNPPIPYQNTTGLQVTSIPNPYIQWEETRKWQGGIDFGLVNDRIVLGATYALNKSTNQIISYILPTVTGFPSTVQNFPAVIRNTNWEFTLNTFIVKEKDFNWTSNINFTIPKNKLVSFPDIEETSYALGFDGVIVGQPLGVNKVYRYAGVDALTGRYLVFNKDGQPTLDPNSIEDMTALVPVQSKYYGGWLNSVSFKGFQIDFLFQFVYQNGFKHLYFSNGIVVPGRYSSSGANNQPVTILNRWQKPGDIAAINRFTTMSSNGATMTNSNADYSYDASFIRLKNVSISWQMPSQFTNRIKLQSCLLYFRGDNLATISQYSGLDPETQTHTTLPPLQMWTVGMKFEL
ncbi:SusC/RagA family TonB-linked outer membrane protein [Longitalea arenae]|uniref:SusC/RagA family TonB-linked outer membrane protein n=1 Tax=Longitalea arenae TaxID=2812558 RepID=UPI0019682B14|nr:SusC/RagA family TonB-linked outer membrane protein [Longitalea arenae]